MRYFPTAVYMVVMHVPKHDGEEILRYLRSTERSPDARAGHEFLRRAAGPSAGGKTRRPGVLQKAFIPRGFHRAWHNRRQRPDREKLGALKVSASALAFGKRNPARLDL